MRITRPDRADVLVSATFLAILSIALGVFWPALTGPFLFDDFPNLSALGNNGGIDSLSDLLAFTFGGKAGPLGRPLSLITFAANDQYWPSNPWGFKYTNLLVHLLNGCLIFALVLRLSRRTIGTETGSRAVALMVMAVWLVHPLQISTLMMVVQRMTELATLFILGGLLAYTHGREMVNHRPWAGYIWMSSGIGLGGILAVLCKESGILLPLYAIVLEVTVYRSLPVEKPFWWRLWHTVFLKAPMILLIAYILWQWDANELGYAMRNFGPVERLLTETRILWDYLFRIFIPRMGGLGIFHDDVQISNSLLTPPLTCLASLGLGVLCVSGLLLRNRHPVLSLGILWFLAGHLLESTILPLELYFEHRNYLPMLGMVFAASYYIYHFLLKHRGVGITFVSLFLTIELFLTWNSSAIWGNERLLVNTWATENPTSARAQQQAAKYWADIGDLRTAQDYILKGLHNNPGVLSLQIQNLMLDCLQNSISTDSIEAAVREAPMGDYDNAVFLSIRYVLDEHEQGRCEQITPQHMHQFLDALLQNPHYNVIPDAVHAIWYTKGILFAQLLKLNDAILSFDHAYAAQPDVEVPLLQASLLMSAGLYKDALSYIDIAYQTRDSGLFAANKLKKIRSIESAVRRQLHANVSPLIETAQP